MNVSEFTKSKIFVPLVLVAFSVICVILRVIPFFVCGVEWGSLPDSLYELRLTEIPFEQIDNFTADGNVVSWGLFYTLLLCAGKLMGALPLIPILLAVGTIFVVYFIGKRISTMVGLISAGLIAVLNGSFFYNSTFGAIDHHIAEVFFGALFVLFFLTTVDKKRVGWFIATCLSGLAVMLVMPQCMLFPILLTVFAVICYFTETNCVTVCRMNIFINLFLALMMLLFRVSDEMSFYTYSYALPILLIVLCIVNVMILIIHKVIKRKLIALIVFIALSVLGFIAINLSVFSLSGLTSHLIPASSSGISEMSPYSLSLFLSTFGLCALLLVIALVAYILMFKKKSFKIEHVFIALWFVVTLWLTICHCRWEYYLAVPAVLLIGSGIYYVFEYVKSNDIKFILKILAVLSIFICVGLCSVTALSYSNDTEKDWQNIGQWLQDNTPDQPYEENGNPTYRILSHWEYGHYIEVWGHRCPYSNPFQTNYNSENMLITGENIPSDIKYVILNDYVFNHSYASVQVFAHSNVSLNESVMYGAYYNSIPLYEFNGIKIFTKEEFLKGISGV